MKRVKIAVIGGGAAGLLSAVLLKQAGVDDFAVFEKGARVGKKLAATGNGQGNLANVYPRPYHSRTADFYKPATAACGLDEVRAFYRSLGVLLTEGECGRLYPASKQATAVVDLILWYLKSENTAIYTDCEITSLKKADGGFILTDKREEQVFSKYVLFAVGGKAGGKAFGTDGSAYALCVGLGHKLTDLKPSLVQVKSDVSLTKPLHGIKSDVILSAYDGKTKIGEARGDLLFTEYGVSGNTVFNVSGALSGAKEPRLVAAFLPDITEEELVSALSERSRTMPYLTGGDVFTGLINKQIGKKIVERAGSENPADLAAAAKAFYLPVSGSLGFDYAQTTKGGIDCADVDGKTMESHLVRGLYFAGEVLDVDGDCGGYNLQFALASAMAATTDIIRKIKGE